MNFKMYSTALVIFLKMVAAITTYMVIFIQFMPKEPLDDKNVTKIALETTTAIAVTMKL